jgi:hypothetical protein
MFEESGCEVPEVVLALQNLSAAEEAAVESALNIIVEMLAVTPSQRPDAMSVLQRSFFADAATPTSPHKDERSSFDGAPEPTRPMHLTACRLKRVSRTQKLHAVRASSICFTCADVFRMPFHDSAGISLAAFERPSFIGYCSSRCALLSLKSCTRLLLCECWHPRQSAALSFSPIHVPYPQFASRGPSSKGAGCREVQTTEIRINKQFGDALFRGYTF